MTAPADSPLAAIEAQHGFVFGGPVPASGSRMVATVSCPSPDCARRGQHIPVHDDAVAPLLCGETGCHVVLHCDHTPTTQTYREGTIGAPMQVTETVCTTCRQVLERISVPGPAINLATLPIQLLDQPL